VATDAPDLEYFEGETTLGDTPSNPVFFLVKFYFLRFRPDFNLGNLLEGVSGGKRCGIWRD